MLPAMVPGLRPQLSINISCLQGAQQQTCWPLLLPSIDGTNGGTDGHPTITQTLLGMVCIL